MKVKDVIRGRREISAGRAAKPKVSIVTPTYKRNLEGLLAPCIESALAQSFSDLELIIIDDGSSDGTEDTVRGYAKHDDRIRYYRHDQNSGLPAVRTNEGVMLSRGEAVAFLFDDNVLTKDFIGKAYEVLSTSEIDVVHSNVHMLGHGGADFTLGDWPFSLELLGNLNTIPNGGVLCRKDFFDRYGLYDPHILLRRICDWDLWLRSAHLGAKFQHLDFVAATEHGLVSENSIGNTIGWDVKIAYGYMFDTKRYAERAISLRPSAIGDFDVLDTRPVLPYVRNSREWRDVVQQVYKPFSDRNPDANNYTLTLTNRTQLDHFGFSWAESPSPSAGRRRTLLVSNTYNEHVQRWEQALAEAQNICVHTPEWQLSAIPVDSVDLLILADACAPFIAQFVQKFADAGVPVLYSSHYGFMSAEEPRSGYQQYAPIKKVLGADMYLPGENVPFSADQCVWARNLLAQATAVVVNAESNAELPGDWVIAAPPVPSDEWLRNVATTVMYARTRKQRSRIRPKAVVALNSELLSGSEAYGIMIAKGLKDSGFEVEVWIADDPVYGIFDSALADRLSDLDLAPSRSAPYKPGPQFLALDTQVKRDQAAALSSHIRDSGPDLIVCSGFIPVFAWADRQHAKLFMCLFQASAYDPASLSQLYGRIDGWICDSQWSHDKIAQVLPTRSGVARSTVPSLKHVDGERPQVSLQLRIAVGGTLQPRKGQLESVKALHLLRERGHDAILNLYGYALPGLDWYKKEIEKTVLDLGLADRVNVFGLTSLDALADDNDIILSASSDESVPQTVAESIARGLIPVVALSGGIDELVVDGTNGFVAENHAPEQLAAAIERAICARDEWPVLRRKSAEILTKFTSEKANTVVLSLLLKAMQPLQMPSFDLTPCAGLPSLLPNSERRERLERLQQLKAKLSEYNNSALR